VVRTRLRQQRWQELLAVNQAFMQRVLAARTELMAPLLRRVLLVRQATPRKQVMAAVAVGRQSPPQRTEEPVVQVA
jgi:hypothetical protein